MMALSKTLDPADVTELADELTVVDRFFSTAREQHPMRRWEYALALRASDAWAQADHDAFGHANRLQGGPIYDVGGAGSPFYHMIGPEYVRVIDPDDGGYTLAQYHRKCAVRLGHQVFCLSVLEHVDNLDQFLYHLACLTAPGGLLFLTFDFTDDLSQTDPVDHYHFHWMRKRIFNAYSLATTVTYPLVQVGFRPLGLTDYTAHGPQVYDYTFASLALVKRS